MREKTGGRAEYRSAIRSRRMIREAYTVLLKEKDLSKITVTDIVNRADINRATFYAHYCCCNSVDTWKKMRSFTVSLSRLTAPRCSWKS